MGKQQLKKRETMWTAKYDDNQVLCSGIKIKVIDCSGWKLDKKMISIFLKGSATKNHKPLVF